MLSVLYGIYRNAGGWRFVFVTPYIYLAAFITFVVFDRNYESDWAALAISVFPSLVGFSLATFAIVLAIFGQENLARLSKRRDGELASPLAKLTALIVHGSLVQISALILAVSTKQAGLCTGIWSNSCWQKLIGFLCVDQRVSSVVYVLGVFLMMYGLILIISTILTVFQTSEIAS